MPKDPDMGKEGGSTVLPVRAALPPTGAWESPALVALTLTPEWTPP